MIDTTAVIHDVVALPILILNDAIAACVAKLAFGVHKPSGYSAFQEMTCI
jgi:hypothetical protein